MAIPDEHICKFETENGHIFIKLIEEHKAEGTCACIEGKIYRGRGHMPSSRILKMCACMLERAVRHLETHYRHPDSLTSEFKQAGYCRSLPEKAFKEIHGDIYSQIDLSQLVRELKAEVIQLRLSNADLNVRLIRLEEKFNSS